MKGKFFRGATALTLLLTMILPAHAALEYGVIYDETELLRSAEIDTLGQDRLPAFTAEHGIDMRVDVLTGLGDFSSVKETAPALYDAYEYGSGDGRNGVTMTLLVEEDDTGAALKDWYIYFAGTDSLLVSEGPGSISSDIHRWLSPEAWNGDAEQDARALANAITLTVDGVEQLMQTGNSAEETVTADALPAPLADSGNWQNSAPLLGHVTDAAGLLTPDQRQQLTAQAEAVSQTHGVDVYILTVDNYRDHTAGDAIDAAEAFYHSYALGSGAEKAGLLLMLSMEDRDFAMSTCSDYGEYLFDWETQDEIAAHFLDNFAGNDWFGGFSDYLAAADAVLADGPDRIKSEIGMDIGIILLLPLIPAAIGVFLLGRKMKSVASATQASAYVAGEPELTVREDIFSHTTEVRRKIEKEPSGGGGGGSHRSGGGFTSSSGKF